MRKRIDTIKAVRAREAFKAREDQEKAAPPPAPAASDPPAPASPPPRSMARPGFTALFVRTALALIFILALIFAANEAMVLLLGS